MDARELAQRSFGEWLRQRRRALDLTQEELARQVRCSAITLRKLEAEERRPSKQIAERLADVLQVAPDDRPTFLRLARGDPFAGPTAAQTGRSSGPPQPAPQNLLEVKLLGRFQLLIGGEPTAAVNTPRLQSLFAYLLLQRGVPQSRQTLAFMFWPESTDAQARTNLRTLLHRLRAALPQAETCLSLDNQTVVWTPSTAYRMDVDEFEAAVNAAALAADEASARIAFERANELYRGALFPECYDDWVSAERERLRQLALGALERLVLGSNVVGN